MAHEDFNVAELAAYLHLTPQQVERLANREKLPGRKVGGSWRFARAEIHHWMEDQLGLVDDGELARMEANLQRTESVAGPVVITELLRVEAISTPLDGRTKGSVIRSMTELAADVGFLWDPTEMAAAVQKREELHSTAIDNGVAFLHPRRPMPNIMAEGFLALGVSRQGIPFGGKHLTDLFFLIGSVDDRSHLRTLARLSRFVTDIALLDSIRQAPDSPTIHDLIRTAETILDE